jgi:hypothetical protein
MRIRKATAMQRAASKASLGPLVKATDLTSEKTNRKRPATVIPSRSGVIADIPTYPSISKQDGNDDADSR